MERERLGKYELLERLGRGGMGEVWKARDSQLQRYVAIKLLHADLQADPDFVTYFMREARLVASLHHPNIVQIHDFVVPRLFSSSAPPTPAAASAVAGRILFSRSSHVPYNVFDQVQVDLTNVPSPPGGETYYAWLEQANSEAPAIPHWSLQVKNGAINMLYTGSAVQGDLYTPSVMFLVTAENAGGSPIVPIFEPNRHLYYALITHTSTAEPVFEIRRCLQGNANGQANPCR